MSQLLFPERAGSLVLSDIISALSSISSTDHRDTGSIFKAPKASNAPIGTQTRQSDRQKRL
jgi:hypothetical protein